MVANAAFVTLDNNFLNRAPALHSRYGITVASPNLAWDSFAPRYSLVEPTELDAGIQETLLSLAIAEAESGGVRKRAQLRTALAVTDGFLPQRDTILTRRSTNG
jgi:hypothetical protein